MNLLVELQEKLKENGKEINDIVWVGSRDLRLDTAEFLAAAARTEYDNGYGGAEISQNLIIVGSDWWLERGEYDGSEWFEFKTMPKMPDELFTGVIKTLRETGYSEGLAHFLKGDDKP